MWNDVETTTDLLNFTIVADTAAQLIQNSDGQPLSIGVSGNWGAGKSSLVKMIGASLRKADTVNQKYIFIEFNAWLYQGYDDARMALLQTVADKLVDEAKSRKTNLEKAIDFAKRIHWLRIGKLLASTAAGAVIGGTVAGPFGAISGIVGGIFKGEKMPSPEEFEKAKEAYSKLLPEIKELIKADEAKSLPKEIMGIRNAFQEVLQDMNVTLIVLVDDLDRCLPDTAISTLEAMRLLLFLPHTAFIIAADEQMIRSAVRAHFGSADLNDDLVTSYFDKIIQVPLRVPRLGVAEVKAYLILLLADLAERRKNITSETRNKAQIIILEAVRKSWAGGLTHKAMEDAFGVEARKISSEIDLADQLAGIMATAEHISGNPRLIKRFLNDLMIRDTVAKAHGMTIAFEELVKLQLFERCATPAAFEYLVRQVAESKDGKARFLCDLEGLVAKDEAFKSAEPSWDSPFIKEWLKLSPPLSTVDLRPLLYLSRDRARSFASFDELSPLGRELLEALIEAKDILPQLKSKLQALGEAESERILYRLKRIARSEQWTVPSLIRCLNVTSTFPNLCSSFASFLNEVPAEKRPAALIPHIRKEVWAKDILVTWAGDAKSPAPVVKAINLKVGVK